jgi:hypothetical protein
MGLKRIVLLANLALAVVAFAAPTAEGEVVEWIKDGGTVGGFEELHMVGTLASTMTGPAPGPCAVTFTGSAFNINEMAAGTIASGTTQLTCTTSRSGCFVKPTLEGFPWNLTAVTVTGKAGIEITGIKLTTHFEEVAAGNCGIAPLTLTTQGTATGIVQTPTSITLESHMDDVVLKTPPLPEVPADLRGELEATAPLTLG